MLLSDCTETGERKPPRQATAGGGLTVPRLPPRPPGVWAPNPVSAYEGRPTPQPRLAIPRGQSHSLPCPDLGPPQRQHALRQGPAHSRCGCPRPALPMPPAQRPHPLVPQEKAALACWWPKLHLAPAPHFVGSELHPCLPLHQRGADLHDHRLYRVGAAPALGGGDKAVRRVPATERPAVRRGAMPGRPWPSPSPPERSAGAGPAHARPAGCAW